MGKVKMHAPLGHLTPRWRKYALEGEKITSNYYEAAAFDTLKGRMRSGDIAVAGSRRYRPFEHYLLPAAEIERDLISQRTTEALVARKQQGLSLGRPKGVGKSKLDTYQVEITALLKNGATKTWVAKKYGTTRRNLSHWMKQHRIGAELGDRV